MLEVLPIQDKELQEKICLQCGIEYKPELMAYSAHVDGQLVGACQFSMSDKGGRLVDLANANGIKDTQALFVVGRATLNFIDLCGVHYAFYKGEAETEEKQRLIKAIGFKQTESGSFEVDLNGFFTDHCHDKK